MSIPQVLGGVHEEYERLTKNELTNLGVVLGAYRSFRGNRRKHVAYVGMPITTGKRYYDVLTEQGVKTREELLVKCGSQALWELVIKPNIEEGIAFADRLGKQGDRLFIAPSVFEAKPWRWTEDAYMSLWYRVIGELAGAHFVMDGWEYSTGGLKEVLFSMFLQWRIIRRFNIENAAGIFGLPNFHSNLTPQQVAEELEGMWKMKVYDSSGSEITIGIALAKSARAICDLKDRGFDYKDLLEPAWRLKAVPVLSPFSSGNYPYDPFTQTYLEAREKLEKLVAN